MQCACGCGESFSGRDSRGRPRRFIDRTHVRRLNRPNPNPSGLCGCGCGQATKLAPTTDATKGWVEGFPKHFVYRHRPSLSDTDYRVEDRGYKTPCWIWLGTPYKNGYGVLRGRRAHRVFYEARFGPIPAGLEPDHLCSQKICVNPDHLEPVTHLENVRRSVKHTRLTMDKAREIRRLRATGMKQQAIGDLFGVSQETVSLVVRGKQWREHQ